MRIVFDGRWIGRTGIGRYSYELLRELQEVDAHNEYIVLLLPETFAKWEATNPNFSKMLVHEEVYTFAEQLTLPWKIRALKPDVVHFPHFAYPILYPGKFVVTVHDMTLVHFKNTQNALLKKVLYEIKYWAMRLTLWSAVWRAKEIITPTEYVKAELVRRYLLKKPKVTVTLEGVSEDVAKADGEASSGIDGPFIMYVGNYYPYKNVERMIRAYAKSETRARGVKFVIVGKEDYFRRQLEGVVDSLGLNQLVIFAGRVSDEELAGLYQHAELYVFPSLSEGFGIPGLEAMSHGTPVLSSNASCLPEVYGEAAEYFDPMDVSDMTAKLDGVLGNRQRLAELSKAGFAQVSHFSWAGMARLTLAVYKEAVRPNGSRR
jgi:glycosyltransferase involved in cell wall biosynthesis